jgi:WD40 repeat protein
MNARCFAAWLLYVMLTAIARGQEAPGDKEPLLRLEAGGPTSFVTAPVFSSDGKTLYAAGWDKVVRVWTLQEKQGTAPRFVLDRSAYRVPIGPGLQGVINALALSPDDTWLAVAGSMAVRGTAGFGQSGIDLPRAGAMTDEMLLDQGTIYAFNTRTRDVQMLRGHRGPVLSLAFAPQQAAKTPQLVSAGQETEAASGQRTGVIRVWDLAKGEVLATRKDLPDPANRRPGLAAWFVGQGALQVALAWEDSKLRIWDVTKDQILSVDDGRFNNSIAALPATNKVLTASWRDGAGQVQEWSAGKTGQRATIPPDGQRALVPRAMTLLSAKGNGQLDHAAVIVRKTASNAADEEDRLDIIDLKTYRTVAQHKLWSGGGTLPSVSATARGQHLVVAGNREHEIWLFPIAGLLANKAQVQKLNSAGTTIGYVSFVQKGTELGLLLNEAAPVAPALPARGPAAGDLVFDVNRRVLTTNRDGWKSAHPALDGWDVRFTQSELDKQGQVAKPPTFLVYKGQGGGRLLELTSAREVTAFALLPPRDKESPPILAVAYLDRFFQPVLALYNATTREQFRRFTGHLARITALAFSADGRLLASAAQDQTVCVWSLTNLDAILGKRGQLSGVAVETKEKAVVVNQVDLERVPQADQAKLQKGDVIEGLVEGDQVRLISSARDFYTAIFQLKPGDKVTVSRKRQDKLERVALTIGQAVDERKPLWFFFVSRGAKPEERDWIGWNPLGAHEASDRDAERYLVWHFNTGKADAPTRSVLADQYRKEDYRLGILKHLVAQASLDKALKSWEDEQQTRRLHKPGLSLAINDAWLDPKQADAKGHFLIRQPPQALRLTINNFPVDRIGTARWQIDDGKSMAFDEDSGLERVAHLKALSLKPGIHRVRVTLRTNEADPREFIEETVLRYQPPSPTVTLPSDGMRRFVETPEFTLQATAQPAQPGQKVKLSVVLIQQGVRKVILEKEIAGELKLNEKIELKKGDNLCEIIASNSNPLAGYEEWETSRVPVLITYAAKAPELSLLRVTTEGTGQSLDIKPGQPVQVAASKVRILGQLKAKDNLATLEWRNAKDKDRQKVNQFVANKVKEFAIDQQVTLVSGPQEFQFHATAGGAEATASVTIDYRPAVPRLVLATPETALTVYEDGKATRELPLEFKVIAPPDRQPFEAVVLVDGQKQTDKPVFDAKADKLTAKARLQPGTNRIQVELTNQWQATSMSEPIVARYLRPARIVETSPKESKKPLVDLVANVVSATPLVKDTAVAEVNGRKIGFIEMADAGQGNWTVRLRDVPLDAGKNEVRLWVSNAEAQTREPGAWTINFVPQRPPEVSIVQPAVDTTVTEPESKVRAQIKSATPLRRVEIVREGRTLLREPVDVSKLKTVSPGLFDLPETIIKLESGENRLRIESVNDGGLGHATVVVGYRAMPVRVVIDGLRVPNLVGKLIAPERHPDGRLSFPPLAEARFTVEGRVLWDQESDEQLGKINQVRVFVNGCQQLPAELKKPAAASSRERAFQANLVLNRADKNLIEVELPNLKQEAGSRPEFLVSCSKPEPEQALHLLIVGLGQGTQNEQEIKERAIHAIHAQKLGSNPLRSPAFSEVRIYGPLLGYDAVPRLIYTQLSRIKAAIRDRARNGQPNDVVMIYYSGAESADAEGHFLATSDTQDPLRSDFLASLFAEFQGTQLLLLDVNRKAEPSQVKWSDRSRIGLFRYARLDPVTARKDSLIAALDEAIDQSSRLKEVAQFLRSSAAKVAKDPVQYDAHVPTSLEDLVIGSRLPSSK